MANRSDRELRDKMIFPWQQKPLENHFQKWCHKHTFKVFQKWTKVEMDSEYDKRENFIIINAWKLEHW